MANNKGIKDTIYVCNFCGIEFPFKGYSFRNKYCTHKCSVDHKLEKTKDTKRKEFEEGTLSNREWIYKLLVEDKGNKCSVCFITDWNNKPIRLWVDHIDGNATNNNKENFRLICPNCDTQSPTFGAKNHGKGRKSRGLPQYG